MKHTLLGITLLGILLTIASWSYSNWMPTGVGGIMGGWSDSPGGELDPTIQIWAMFLGDNIRGDYSARFKYYEEGLYYSYVDTTSAQNPTFTDTVYINITKSNEPSRIGLIIPCEYTVSVYSPTIIFRNAELLTGGLIHEDILELMRMITDVESRNTTWGSIKRMFK